MSIAEDVRDTPSFHGKPGALAGSGPMGFRVYIRLTDSNRHLVNAGSVPVLKDWGTVGVLLGLITDHPAVYRVTELACGFSAIPAQAAHVGVSLHKGTGFHCTGECIGEVLAEVLVHLDQRAASQP